MKTTENTGSGTLENAKLDGIAVGVLMSFDEDHVPNVVFAGNLGDAGIPARSIVALTKLDIGCEVALSFENGNPASPIILGRVIRPEPITVAKPEAEVDDTPTPLEITGEREVTLRCGKASITLTREGKIILRGTYISSRSSGMNRIKGGSVQLN